MLTLSLARSVFAWAVPVGLVPCIRLLIWLASVCVASHDASRWVLGSGLVRPLDPSLEVEPELQSIDSLFYAPFILIFE